MLRYRTLNIGKGKLDLRFDTLVKPLVLFGRHITGDSDCLKLQYDILHALLKLEVGIREINNQIAQLPEGDKQRTLLESDREWLKELHLIVRMTGSLIPWQLLHSWEITALSQNPSPGYIIGKEGFGAEIQLLREQFGVNGDIIILNDLTHCLTLGDAVNIHKDGTADHIEVKSGKKARLSTNQRERMQDAESYMETGVLKPSNLQLTKQWHKTTHNWSQLESLLDKAKKEGYAVKHPQSSITYLAFKPRARAQERDRISRKIENFQRNDRVISKFKPIRAAFLSETISGADKLRGVPPPTAFKISDGLLLRVLRGDLDVVSFFSPFHPQLTKELIEVGLSLELINGNKLEDKPSDHWQSIANLEDGTPQYLACRKLSNRRFILIDHTVLKLLYTFESEGSLKNSLIQAFDEFSSKEENLPEFNEDLSGKWDIKLEEQLLRSWQGKLMKRRPTHFGLDQKEI